MLPQLYYSSTIRSNSSKLAGDGIVGGRRVSQNYHLWVPTYLICALHAPFRVYGLGILGLGLRV